jgi:Putative restriction endonuclease
MLAAKPRTATYADLAALPAHTVGEIVFGVLHAQPRPAPRHAIAANAVGSTVTGPFQMGHDGPGGWLFMVEPELHLGPHIVVPDIAGWRRERLTPFPETAFIETPPDWLCEVLSPSTQALDRTEKLSVYATAGVDHCWYVDPLARTLEVFALTAGKWLLAATFRDADPVTAPPFEAHTFPLDNLWVPPASSNPA